MSVYVDKKYISLLSPKLSQFKQRGEFLWNFRCPVCGDSHKDKLKTRGYIYKRKDHFSFMCHNCGSSMGLSKFIKYVDPALYDEYQLESFVKSNTSNSKVDVNDFVTTPTFDISSAPRSILLTDAKSINSLKPYHPAREYLDKRKVPIDNLYYVKDFADFIKKLYPWNDKTLYKEPRIIIPFYNKDGNLLGVQGRSIGPSKIKYITIKGNDNDPKIFGWNRVDTSKILYVCEGPLDSLFLTNSLATMDAALYHAPSIVGLDKDYIFVYDNEPRSKQITNNVMKTIDMGYKVCIWPEDMPGKDINEFVMNGMSPSQIQHIIDQHIYEGIRAKLEFYKWCKV